jgi:hypothetical protein
MRREEEALGRRIVRVAGSALLLLFAAITAVGPTAPVVANPPGFATPAVGIELAATPREIFDVVGPPGDPARADAVRRVRAGLLLDVPFLLAYPAFHVGAALLLRARGRLGPRLVGLVAALAATMAVGDALENRELWLLTGLEEAPAMRPALARLRAFTLVKWHALFLAAAVLAVGTARERSWWRWSAPFFAAGAFLGFASVVHLPAIEWSMGPIAVAWAMTWAHALGRGGRRAG